ncbi:MAG: uroporphyrinogen decarboxylase family protein [Chloroflexota bacterium]
MRSRDRVLAALNHEEPDRVPIDLGSTGVTSITKRAYVGLRRELGLPAEDVEVIDLVQQLPSVGEDVLAALGVDTRALRVNPPGGRGPEILDEGDYLAFYDEFGAKLRMPKQDGYYFDWTDSPLAEPRPEALAALPWPDPDDPSRYAGLRERARALYEETDYALVGVMPLGGDLMLRLRQVRGFAEGLMDLLVNEDFAEVFLDKVTDLALRSWSHFLAEVGEYIQVAVMAEDLGTQTGPLVSPSLYRRLIKPRQAHIVQLIKQKSRAKVFLHSCGAVYDFLPDLVEVGFDILNPVQLAAAGMGDTARLKREFGRHLVFWGGACDIQRVLPFGSAEQVREETCRRVRDLAPGGGFVLAASHNIQADVPSANVVAMFAAGRDCGRYPPRGL